MSRDKDPIDIEKIISEIKEDIASKYSYQEILAMEPIGDIDSLIYLTQSLGYDERYFDDRLNDCVKNQRIEWDRKADRVGLSAFLMKAVKRLTRFIIAPIVEDQNRYNSDVSDVLMQMRLRMNLLEEENDSLRRKIAANDHESSRCFENQ